MEFRKESYSSLSLYKQCPKQYKIKYCNKQYTKFSSLAMEIGTLCHKIKELQKKDKMPIKELLYILKLGCYDNKEKILGSDDLKQKYFEDFIKAGRYSQLTYQQKLLKFSESLQTYTEDDLIWETIEIEKDFIFKFEDIEIGGKIDRIDKNIKNNELRIIDYKTNDKVFDDKQLVTALQMYIYNLALQNIYGKYAIENRYDFILLGETQYALTKGWEKRGERLLKKIIDELKRSYEFNDFDSSPTPLCYWCPFSKNTIIKDSQLNGLCDDYSYWTPENKTFQNNKKKEGCEKEKTFIW